MQTKKGRRDRSARADRSGRSAQDRSKSQRSVSSKKSEMTENPMNFEHSMIHRAPGIDDADSKIYREYDQSGRNQNAFQQRATLAGIKNL